MSDASGQRPYGASHGPRHERQDPLLVQLSEDPFVMPDPVEEQLRRWRSERASRSLRIIDDANRGDPSENGEASAGTPQDPSVYEADSSHTDSESSHYAEPSVAKMDVPPTPVPASVSERFGLPSPKTPGRNGYTVESPTVKVASGTVPAWQTRSTDGPEFSTKSIRTLQAPTEPAVLPAPAIEAKNLHKRFKDMVAVEDVSFTVPSGSIVALLGPNGAGKTTTVNMLCTLLKPDGGTATVNGYHVEVDAAAVRKSIMLTGQFAALDESLTGRENLILFGRLLGLDKPAARARADELLDVFALTDVRTKRVREYSGGMRRRIDIACGLVTSPKIVFLDEPTTGLDPRSRQEVWTLVEKLRDSGVTILLTTQYLEEADVLSDNIVVIDKGRVIAEGTSDELKASTGSACCEITPTDPADLVTLRTILADLIGDHSQEETDHFVAVPAPGGPETLVEVIHRTSAAGIALSDVAMRRPTLDEVFLTLTDPRRDRSNSQ